LSFSGFVLLARLGKRPIGLLKLLSVFAPGAGK
jgi:hypothetical protein